MAKGKQRPTFEKRRRERDKQDKRADKRERRRLRNEAKKLGEVTPFDPARAPDGPAMNREELPEDAT